MTTYRRISGERDARELSCQVFPRSMRGKIQQVITKLSISVVVDTDVGVPLDAGAAGWRDARPPIRDGISLKPDRLSAAVCKRTAAPSGVSVHQRHRVMFEFSPWRFFVLHEPAVCGRRGLDAHPCGRCGCGQDGWRPRCQGGGNGSPLSRQAARRGLL